MKKIFSYISMLIILVIQTGFTQTANHGSLRGSIVNQANKEPLIGANVIILGTTMGAMSDLQGRFFIPRIPAGQYKVRATLMGYKSAEKDVTIVHQQETSLQFELKETVLEMPELIVTAGKKAQSFQDVSNSVSLVTSREIERRNRVYLDEVLEYTPGLNVMEGDVNIRGSSGFSLGAGSRVLLLVDGIPMMPGDSGDIKWDIIPLSQIDRVEIIKGAGSALYGSYALGGVINVISKEPSEMPITDVKLSAGVYDEPYYPEWKWTDRILHFNQADITHSRKWKNVGWLISAGRKTSTGYQQNGEFTNWSLLGRTDIQLSPQKKLIVQSNYSTGEYGEIFQWRNQNDVYQMPVTSVGDWVNSSKFSFNTLYRQLVNSKFTFKLRGSYFYNYWKHHYHDNDDYSGAKKLGFEFQSDYIVNPVHSLTFGIESIYDITNSAMFGDHNGTTLAAFVQDEIRLSTMITTTLGFRYDYHHLDTGAEDNQFNPKLGIAVKPSLLTTIRSSVGRGFRSPTMAEMFTQTTTSGFKIVPNPELKAEKAWSYEIGVNQILSENMLFDIAAFHNDYENFIEPERDEQNTVMFVNSPRARIRGIELSLQSTWWKKRILAGINYTYLDPKYISKDKTFWWRLRQLSGEKNPKTSFATPLAYRPQHLVTCAFSVQFGPIEAGVDYRYISRLDSVKVFPDDDRVSQNIVDARIGYHLKRISVSANANNVLNYNYTQVERNMAPMRHYVLTVSTKF